VEYHNGEYLRNATRNRQSENGVANYGHFRTGELNSVYFGPQTAKYRTGVLTHSTGGQQAGYCHASSLFCYDHRGIGVIIHASNTRWSPIHPHLQLHRRCFFARASNREYRDDERSRNPLWSAGHAARQIAVISVCRRRQVAEQLVACAVIGSRCRRIESSRVESSSGVHAAAPTSAHSPGEGSERRPRALDRAFDRRRVERIGPRSARAAGSGAAQPGVVLVHAYRIAPVDAGAGLVSAGR